MTHVSARPRSLNELVEYVMDGTEELTARVAAAIVKAMGYEAQGDLASVVIGAPIYEVARAAIGVIIEDVLSGGQWVREYHKWRMDDGRLLCMLDPEVVAYHKVNGITVDMAQAIMGYRRRP